MYQMYGVFEIRVLKRLNRNFTLLVGDFLDIYIDKNHWDVVITCFFIDTGRNIMNYLDSLGIIVKDKGYWINLGPLLYHYDEMNEISVELTYEELRIIIPLFGFKFFQEKLGISTIYTSNRLSMLQMAYNTIFFTCKRTK